MIGRILNRVAFDVIDDARSFLNSKRATHKPFGLELIHPSVVMRMVENRITSNGGVQTSEYEQEFSPIYSCKISDASVDLSTGACVYQRKYLFRQSISIQKSFFQQVYTRLLYKHTKSIKFDTGAIVSHNKNTWHFLFDDLGYLLLHQKSNEIDKVILPFGTAEFVLRALSISFPNATIVKSKTNVVFEEYQFLTKQRYSQFPHPLIVDRLRNDLAKHGKTSAEVAQKSLVYISRSRSKARKVQRETELEEYIKLIGGDVVWLEDLKFEEQIGRLLNAKVIIGLHGAGLSHMLWAPSQALVLEILPQQEANACYLSLANACAHRYYSIECDDCENSEYGSVPIKQIKEFLNSQLELR